VFNLENNQLHAPHLLSQHNINRFFFSPEFTTLYTMMGEAKFDYARRFIMLYKLWTLKYREHWYFQRLLPELNRYPVFSRTLAIPAFS